LVIDRVGDRNWFFKTITNGFILKKDERRRVNASKENIAQKIKNNF